MLRAAPMLLLFAVPALAAQDPRALLGQQRPDFSAARLAAPDCAAGAGPYDLPALIDLALCANPATAVAWAAARTAAAQAGQARGTLLPTVSGTVSPNFNATNNFGSGQFGGINPVTGLPIGSGGTQTLSSAGASLSIQYLLFDFGGRRARIDAADAQRRAAIAGFAETAQDLVAQVAQGYNAVLANTAAVRATDASVAFARASRDAAAARERAGVGLRSDTLQAETALAQALLARRQAEGQAEVARGQLAVAVGAPPQTLLPLAPPPPLAAPALAEGADALIAAAERARPDIARARETADAARAQARAARSELLPSVGLGVTPQVAFNDAQRNSAAVGVGVTLSLPLFNGFGRTYALRAAESEVDRNAALAEQARRNAGLDVWTQYSNLRTSVAALDQARAAEASATEAARLAQGRFSAGVGTLTDLLNAQNALAQARLQAIQAEFGVRNGAVLLARAVGDVEEIRR